MAKAEEIRQLFVVQGWSVAAWARDHGFPASLVYRVLRGETQCLRGQTHEIGLALGIKDPPNESQKQLLSHNIALLRRDLVDPNRRTCDQTESPAEYAF